MIYRPSCLVLIKNVRAVLAFILFLSWAGWTNGHAVVTRYTLNMAQLQAKKPASATFIFNSQIELGLSQVFLVRKGDVKELLSISKGIKPGEMVVAIPPLEAGAYALSLKVFAADGHLTEDIIRFHVDPPALNKTPPLVSSPAVIQ
jgi:methionine-rich copper-binding protein CopC